MEHVAKAVNTNNNQSGINCCFVSTGVVRGLVSERYWILIITKRAVVSIIV